MEPLKKEEFLERFDHLESIIIELQHTVEEQKKSYDQLIALERDTIITTSSSSSYINDVSEEEEGYEGEPYPLKLPFICHFCRII